MKDRGWVKYLPSTNTPQMLYKAEDRTETCWWVQVNLQTINPQIERTDRLNCQVYTHDLHTELQPQPNFNIGKGFQDNHLQVFFPEFSSQQLIN
jgi:hypothetical protein